jgi:hypothetical protein
MEYLNILYGLICSSCFCFNASVVVIVLVSDLICNFEYNIKIGPNKATRLVWGQWDLNVATKWVQCILWSSLKFTSHLKLTIAEQIKAQGVGFDSSSHNWDSFIHMVTTNYIINC